MLQGTDPMSASQQPVEGFELIIPSTQVSLGAWDIIGVLTGVPLGLWICAGLLTRTQRGRKYEGELEEAENIEELNLVAEKYENSLMWKMIGPHQALRLERMRTEIERDKFTDLPKSDPFDELASKREQKSEVTNERVEGEEAKPELEQQKISQKQEIAGEKNSEEIVPVMELENRNK